MPHERRIPMATYRLQFNRQFTFHQAVEILEYLEELGVTDCYASPLFTATPESTHGYDQCDFRTFSPVLGGVSEFERFSAARRKLGMGLLLDIVPNHMGSHLSNAAWLEVLELGPVAPSSRLFDIDWNSPDPALRGKVLLPVLEDHYAKVLAAGKLKLVFDQDSGAFGIAYYGRTFPVSADSYPGLLGQCASLDAGLREQVSSVLQARPEAGSIPDWERFKGRLASAAQEPNFRTCIEGVLNRHNHSEQSEPNHTLNALLQQQHYRLAYWRVGSDELNYRRFFDVTDLVSMRMEDERVFEETHQLVFDLVRQGHINGLRIDHPDGLRNPKRYFERLQQHGPIYVVVEKILSGDEPIPEAWPVQGTTGYDFLVRVNGLFVASQNEAQFDQLYRSFTGENRDFETIAAEAKHKVLTTSLYSEWMALTRRAKQIAGRTLRGIDFSQRQLQSALATFISAFPVYRTYIEAGKTRVSESDREVLGLAFEGACHRQTGADPEAIRFVHDLVSLEQMEPIRGPESEPDLDELRQEFTMRFQQLTGPVMAKGVEDTSFYTYFRFLSLNEVGGEPGSFGTPVEVFHQYNAARAVRWPHSLLATATHDTKRGEDARARLNVLSEMPDRWRAAVARWSIMNQNAKAQMADGTAAPDANDEYFIYQTLVGAWEEPANDALIARLQAYVLKALKESKRHTTWTDPNEAYENAARTFLTRITEGQNTFLSDFRTLLVEVSIFGIVNSLSQALLKLTCPGVPDIYQGTELWDFSMVDPDNRRPVDFDLRRQLFEKVKSVTPQDLPELLSGFADGRVKLFLIWRALMARKRNIELFNNGQYTPLKAEGLFKAHVYAFSRHLGSAAPCVIVVPRLVYSLTSGAAIMPIGEGVWKDTRLHLGYNGLLRNVFTGATVLSHGGERSVPLGQVLQEFPVALLEPDARSHGR